MKNWKRWMAIGFTLVAVVAAVAPASAQEEAQEEKSWTVELGLDYSTLYMFRGLNLLGEDQDVWTPYASVGLGNWSIWYYGYMGKFDTFDDDGNVVGDGDYNEADFGIDYTFAIGEKMELTVGGLVYLYDKETTEGTGYEDTTEVYAIAAWDVPLAPTLSYYHDVDAIDGGFLTIDVSHSWPLTDSLGLDLMGQVGLDFGYNRPDDPEAGVKASSADTNHFMVGVNLPLQLTDSFSMRLLVQQFVSLDIADEYEQPDETVVTVGATYSF